MKFIRLLIVAALVFFFTAVSAKAQTAPAITSATTATGTNAVSFSYQITASNTPTWFGAYGLPDGLGITGSNGLIGGKPNVSGQFPVTIIARNAAGSGSASLVLTVLQPAYGGDPSQDGPVVNIGNSTPDTWPVTSAYVTNLIQTGTAALVSGSVSISVTGSNAIQFHPNTRVFITPLGAVAATPYVSALVTGSASSFTVVSGTSNAAFQYLIINH